MWQFPDWPFTRSSIEHQVDVMVAMIRAGLDPEKFYFYDDPEPLLSTAREIAAGD